MCTCCVAYFIYITTLQCRNSFGSWSPANASSFSPKRALVLTKLSRYEFEKLRHKNLDEAQLEDTLRKRGSDYSKIFYEP